MNKFNARIESMSMRFRANFYRQDGHESQAEELDSEADYFDQLADDELLGLRRMIRRETGIVHQTSDNMRHR